MTQRTSDLQSKHYDRILSEYDAEYGDSLSLEYRQRFFLDPLLCGLNLNGKNVADLAAGSGHTTMALKRRFPEARIVGFDVSERAVRTYRDRTGCEAHVWDIGGPELPVEQFDVGIVVGGLHHCIRSIDTALRNLAFLVRPDGVLLMVEPNRDTFFEPLRRLWYTQDGYFESSTEGALSHEALLQLAGDRFEPIEVRYMGGVAYFVVYNSLVLRVPSTVKRIVAQPLMSAEALTNRFPVKQAFPYFIARWRRR